LAVSAGKHVLPKLESDFCFFMLQRNATWTAVHTAGARASSACATPGGAGRGARRPTATPVARRMASVPTERAPASPGGTGFTARCSGARATAGRTGTAGSPLLARTRRFPESGRATARTGGAGTTVHRRGRSTAPTGKTTTQVTIQ
jgi:hypothetical protein